MSMYCPNCGQELPDGSAFCGNCGQRMEAAPAPAYTPNPGPAPAPKPKPARSIPTLNSGYINLISLGVSAMIFLTLMFSWFSFRISGMKLGVGFLDWRKFTFGDIGDAFTGELMDEMLGVGIFMKVLAVVFFLVGIGLIALQMMVFSTELFKVRNTHGLVMIASLATAGAAVTLMLLVAIFDGIIISLGGRWLYSAFHLRLTPAPFFALLGSAGQFVLMGMRKK